MPPLSHQLESVTTWIGWAAGIAAAAAAVATYARQWPASYRRFASWVLAVSGVLLASSTASWLIAAHLPLVRGRGLSLLVFSVAGVALTVVGVLRLVRMPVDSSVKALRAIARAAEKYVDDLDRSDGFDSARFIDLSLAPSADDSPRRRSFDDTLWHLPEQMTVVTGDSGSGKTVMLRQLTRRTCQYIYARRNPGRVAIYIGSGDICATAPAATADSIRSVIHNVIAAGDTALDSQLTERLRDPGNRLRWMIVFDSLDGLPTAPNDDPTLMALDTYIEAIRQFLSSAGSNFRAVVLTREPSRVAHLGTAAVTLPPLSHIQQRNLIRRTGLDSTTKRQLLRRLRNDTSLKEIAGNPLLLSLVCDHLRGTTNPTLPATLYEIIQTSLATRFRSLQDSIVADDIMRAAEYVAYLVTSELTWGRPVDTAKLLAAIDSAPEISESSDRVIKTLVTTRICRIEPSNTIAFTHRRFEEHFRAGWLLHSWEAVNIQDLLTNPQWGEATIIGLQSGSEKLCSALTAEAGRILQRDLGDATGIVNSVPVLLQIPPAEALPAPTQFFVWPQVSLHVLQLLAAGLGGRPPLTADITESIDRLVVSAFVSGMLLDKKRAIDVAANASPEVAQWIADRSATSGKELLQRATARLLASRPELFAALSLPARGISAVAALTDSRTVEHTLATATQGAPSAPTLTSCVHNLVRAGQVTAIGLSLYSLRGLIELAFSIHSLRHLATAVPGLAAWILLILSSATFLATWTDRRRLSFSLVKLAGGIIVIASALGALQGVLLVIGAVVLVPALRFSTAFNDILLAYLFTWPMAMAAFVVLGPLPTTADWLAPQTLIVRMGFAAVPFPGKHATTYEGSRIVRKIREFIFFAISIGLLAAVVLAPLPVRHKDANNVRTGLIIALVFSYVALRWLRDHWWTTRIVGRSITGSNGTSFSLLQALTKASTQVATERLLRTLRDAPPGALAPSASTMEDLARALDHVMRMVPKQVKSPIPPAVWDVGPSFRDPGFRLWLITFDKRHPGRLSWLAQRHQGLLAEILDRTETAVELKRTS